MNIHVGNKIGKYIDKLRLFIIYFKFVFDENIKYIFIEYETIINRMYETEKTFIPYKNDLVIDIGSYVCDYAIIWAKKYNAKVIAFEASTQNWKMGILNIFNNHLQDKILSFNVGIGNDNIASIINDKYIYPAEYSDDKLILKKLDDFNLNPFLIKIDIEGFEYNALLGMKNTLNKYKPKLIIETHSDKLWNQCSNFLKDFNYNLIKIQNKRKDGLTNNTVQESFWSVDY